MSLATPAIDADINVSSLGQAHVPRHPRVSSELVNPVSLPARPAPLAHPPSSSPAFQHSIKHYGRNAKTFVAADLRYDDGSFNKPGTAAYYRSFGFRIKQQGTLTHARDKAATAHKDDTATSEDQKATGERVDKKPLVMIFSRNSVRRSTLTGSVANRARNVSKRQ
jgi:hypothetical protein